MVVFEEAKPVLFASERSDNSCNFASAGIASERSVHVELGNDQEENNAYVDEISKSCRLRVNAPTTHLT